MPAMDGIGSDGEVRTYLLVGDGSEESASAARWLAALLAGDRRAQATVVHVIAPVRSYGERLPSGEWFEPDVPLDVAVERAGLAALGPTLELLEMVAPERVRVEIRVGPAADEILGVAAEVRAQAVVLGRRRASAWRRLVRPPLAQVLERRASCPVVEVGPAALAA
jgi:nucleotide-binding universal stress UspA family protein